MDANQIFDFSIRLAAALALGTLIGAEREWRHKLAGLKTNALVCVGAALFSLLGFAFPGGDPSRIAAQIASGIGFLGAGAILRDGLNIRGLTTAATVWCAAAIGALAGAGWIFPAFIGTAFIVTCNVVLKECARIVFKTGGYETLADQAVVLSFSTGHEDGMQKREPIVAFLQSHHLVIKGLSIEPVNGHLHWQITVNASQGTMHPNAESLSQEMSQSFNTPVGWRAA